MAYPKQQIVILMTPFFLLHISDKGSAKLRQNLNLDATSRKRRPKQATQYYQTRSHITLLLRKNVPNNRYQYRQENNSRFPQIPYIQTFP